MTFRQRYAQLQDPAFVKQAILRSVYSSLYSSLALKNQTVPLERLEEMYDELEAERQAKAKGQADEAAPE